MYKIIHFDNENQTIDKCEGNRYSCFLDYAFENTDYFMLVYVNYYGKGYSQRAKDIKKSLEKYKVKTRTNPQWPGTPGTYAKNTTYKIIFYKTDMAAKKVLKQVSCMSDWSAPFPQDLAFFKGNLCWFYSVGHEKIGVIIRASRNDIDFLESIGLAKRNDARPMNEYYMLYDESWDKGTEISPPPEKTQ